MSGKETQNEAVGLADQCELVAQRLADAIRIALLIDAAADDDERIGDVQRVIDTVTDRVRHRALEALADDRRYESG